MVEEPTIRVRRAEAEDAEAIAGVLAAAFAEFAPLYTPGGLAATTPPAATIATRLAEGPIWVAVDGPTVVGTVGAVPRGTDVYVRSMAVCPAARGRGVAGALLEAVETFARDAGAQGLVLSTTPFLAAAIQLYTARGFVRTPGGPADLHGTPLWTMRKTLVPASRATAPGRSAPGR